MNFNNFLSKLFGNKSTRDMKLIQPWVEKVKAAYPAIQSLDNDGLRAKTKELQHNIQSSADDLKTKIEELIPARLAPLDLVQFLPGNGITFKVSPTCSI